MKNDKKLREALLEAAKWDTIVTEYEKTKLSYTDARNSVVNRIFEKYKCLILDK